MLAEGEVYVRELDPETSLWRLVIAQALEDACGRQQFTKSTDRFIRPTAISWFRDAGRDFRAVCILADLEPAVVQAAALRMIKKAEAA
jgi:hypothetical protein